MFFTFIKDPEDKSPPGGKSAGSGSDGVDGQFEIESLPEDFVSGAIESTCVRIASGYYSELSEKERKDLEYIEKETRIYARFDPVFGGEDGVTRFVCNRKQNLSQDLGEANEMNPEEIVVG